MHTESVAREKLFNMRMSAEEWDRAERVAAHYGLNVASLVRFLMKREDDGMPKPAAAKPAKKKATR